MFLYGTRRRCNLCQLYNSPHQYASQESCTTRLYAYSCTQAYVSNPKIFPTW